MQLSSLLTGIFALGALALPLDVEERQAVPQYQRLALVHHNVHRRNHSANAVTWSPSLASSARQSAAKCTFAPESGRPYGQNLGFIGGATSSIGRVVTDLWYNPGEPRYTSYGQPNPPNFNQVGLFTQIVWKNTTQVGCATVRCQQVVRGPPGPGFLTFCNYSPPGNFAGRFGTQVGRPLGRPTVYGNYTGP